MYSAAEGYCSYTTITSCCLLYSRVSIVVLSNTIIESVAVLSFPEQLGYQGNSFCAWTRGTARLTPARKCWLRVNFSQPSYYICTQPCFPTEWFRFINNQFFLQVLNGEKVHHRHSHHRRYGQHFNLKGGTGEHMGTGMVEKQPWRSTVKANC